MPDSHYSLKKLNINFVYLCLFSLKAWSVVGQKSVSLLGYTYLLKYEHSLIISFQAWESTQEMALVAYWIIKEKAEKAPSFIVDG